MIKTLVAGAGGRMGGRIIPLIVESGDMEVAGAVEKEGHPAVGRDLGRMAGSGENGPVHCSRAGGNHRARRGHYRFYFSYGFS